MPDPEFERNARDFMEKILKEEAEKEPKPQLSCGVYSPDGPHWTFIYSDGRIATDTPELILREDHSWSLKRDYEEEKEAGPILTEALDLLLEITAEDLGYDRAESLLDVMKATPNGVVFLELSLSLGLGRDVHPLKDYWGHVLSE